MSFKPLSNRSELNLGINALIENIVRTATELVLERKISVPVLYKSMEATIIDLFEAGKLEMFCDLDSLIDAIKHSILPRLNDRLVLDLARFGRSDWEEFVSVGVELLFIN
jgi:hypothetical protein